MVLIFKSDAKRITSMTLDEINISMLPDMRYQGRHVAI